MSTPRITLLGAAGEVTGSATLVDMGERRILVDLGLIQGEDDADQRNAALPDIDVRWLDALVLTHAHVDHAGRLPMLTETTWRGPVFCSEPTADLLALTLKASARLQRRRHFEWIDRRDRRGAVKGESPPPILYDKRQVDALLQQVVPLPFDTPVDLGSGVSIRLGRAGHVLGAAWVRIDGPGGRIVCSGDLGRSNVPPLPAPAPCPQADLVLMESTKGDAVSNDRGDVHSELARIVAAAGHRGRPIVLPTFALGRTQQVLSALASLDRRGLLDMNVYLDSPLAARATQVHAHWPDELSQDHVRDPAPMLEDPLDFPSLTSLMSRRAARRLEDLTGPAIVMAGNGFGEGGPILGHLARWLPDPDATVLLTGHCMPGTLVGHLAQDPPMVRIDGRRIPVEARIERLDAFGGHACADELERWLTHKGPPGRVLLNHGEEDARQALAIRLRTSGVDAACPFLGQSEVA